MASLVAWNRLVAEAQQRGWPCDFALVYIEEAHAQEGWNFAVDANSKMPSLPYARTLADRRIAAAEMMRRYDEGNEAPATAAAAESARVERVAWCSPVFLDTMDDTLCRAYHALPERLYILRGEESQSSDSGASRSVAARIVYRGGEGPFGYSLTEMAETLRMNSGIDMRWDGAHVQ